MGRVPSSSLAVLTVWCKNMLNKKKKGFQFQNPVQNASIVSGFGRYHICLCHGCDPCIINSESLLWCSLCREILLRRREQGSQPPDTYPPAAGLRGAVPKVTYSLPVFCTCSVLRAVKRSCLKKTTHKTKQNKNPHFILFDVFLLSFVNETSHFQNETPDFWSCFKIWFLKCKDYFYLVNRLIYL